MQGFNMGRYRPPDSDPRLEGFNKHTHPLGKRARKTNKGILIVRFELPYTIICTTCNQSLAQGTRYNAEKSHVGNYHSTSIWQFRAKCRHCSQYFIIRTDPQHTRYVVVDGARRKEEQPDQENDQTHDGVAGRMVELGMTDALRGRSDSGQMVDRLRGTMQEDAFMKLDHGTTKQQQLTDRVVELERHAIRHSADPYTKNCTLRTRFREDKRSREQDERERNDFRHSLGWHQDLHVLPLSQEDVRRDREEWRRAKARNSTASAGTSSTASGPPRTHTSRTARHTLLAGVKRSKNAVFK